MKRIIAKIIVGKHKGCIWMFNADDFRLLNSAFKNNYERITEGSLTTQGGVAENGHEFKLFQGNNGKLYRVFTDWSATEHAPATREIQVCTNCGSGNVLLDAFVHANDPNDVRTFDCFYCENCESSCKTKTVTVPADFDICSDIYKEDK